MPRKTYDIRKGRRRAQGEHVNYPRQLIDELNRNRRFVSRSSVRTKQGDT
jgi:hypothetical protein